MTQQEYVAPNHSPLEDEPWQKDDSYWDQLQTASKDPETFEKFIEESMARKKESERGNMSSISMMSSSSSSTTDATASTAETAPRKKKKYVPIEEWDAQRDASGDNMTREERMQWEAQQNGDRFRQNEILMHNLKGFGGWR